MKISIIVPVYNVERYLEQCLDSIINQTYRNVEIILVNDGSTDNSKKICEKYAQDDLRIKLINQSNSGLSVARNIGINNATGEYLMFIDSDDFFYSKDSIKYLVSIITEKQNIDVLIYKMVYYYESSKKYKFDKHIAISNNEDKLKILNCLNEQGYLPMSACVKIINRNFLISNKIFFVPNKYHEDIDWSLRLYFKAKKIFFLDRNIYVYRQQRQGSITNTTNNKKRNDLFETINYWINYKYSNDKEKNVFLGVISYWYVIFRTIYKFKDFNKDKILILKRYNKFLLNYNVNYKVDLTKKVYKIFGDGMTFKILKLYNKIKNAGLIRI